MLPAEFSSDPSIVELDLIDVTRREEGLDTMRSRKKIIKVKIAVFNEQPREYERSLFFGTKFW